MEPPTLCSWVNPWRLAVVLAFARGAKVHPCSMAMKMAWAENMSPKSIFILTSQVWH